MHSTSRVLPAAAAVLSLAVLTAGCGSTPSGVDETRTDTLTAAAAQEPAPAAAAGAGSPALDPLAPEAYRPVVRDGERPRPSVAARGGRFSADAPVTYPDGIAVRVDRVSRSVEQGEGVGVFPGRPLTAFHMTFVNGSARAVDLSQTVVTTTYGVRPRLASPVYTHPDAQDFTGTVAPGATAQATYVFAVPPGQARTVRTMVDFDAAHAAAPLTGLDEG